MDPKTFQFISNLFIALALGAAIGVERQKRQQRAGLRTNALVALGSALFIMLSDALPHHADPSRIAAQIISGIGFLGAGVIMRDGLSVRGLNTAATLWCSSAVGILAGYGLTLKAVIGAVFVLSANVILRPIARRINQVPIPEEEELSYSIRANCSNREQNHVRNLIMQAVSSGPVSLRSLVTDNSLGPSKIVITARLTSQGKQHALLEQLVSRLGIEPGIAGISWSVEPNAGDGPILSI